MTTDWLYNNRTVLMLQVRYGNGISHTCIITQDHTGMNSYFTSTNILHYYTYYVLCQVTRLVWRSIQCFWISKIKLSHVSSA